jgi:hypothetical protein
VLLTGATASSRTLDEFERALRRTPPVTTRFVDYRFSHLLKKPLQASGTLEYRADGVLVRDVTAPYREVTEVLGDEVRIQREGKPARTMSLQRVPPLRVLLGSFRALLEGRLAPLSQDFEVSLLEGEAHWTLTLTPRDPRMARALARIQVSGATDRPDCIVALEPDGDAAFTLLEPPATGGAIPARAALEQRCHLDAAAPRAATPKP